MLQMETLNGVMERGVDPSENHSATRCLSRWYRLISITQQFQIVEEAFRSQDVGWTCRRARQTLLTDPNRGILTRNKQHTDDNFPVLIGSRHFVGSSHFRVGNATHDENEHTRQALHILLSLILVPMTVTSAKMSIIKLVIKDVPPRVFF